MLFSPQRKLQKEDCEFNVKFMFHQTSIFSHTGSCEFLFYLEFNRPGVSDSIYVSNAATEDIVSFIHKQFKSK